MVLCGTKARGYHPLAQALQRPGARMHAVVARVRLGRQAQRCTATQMQLYCCAVPGYSTNAPEPTLPIGEDLLPNTARLRGRWIRRADYLQHTCQTQLWFKFKAHS